MAGPSLNRLLISHITLRGPEIAQLYALIVELGEPDYAALVTALVPAGGGDSPFELAEAPLREALTFLLAAGLVAQIGDSRRRARFRVTPLLADAPFPLLLLNHIGCHPDGRQRAIRLVHAQLVADDAIAVTAAGLREQMERGPHRDLFAWTGEKIGFWCHLAAYLGLARRLERSEQILLAPTPDVTGAALRWGRAHSDDDSLDAALRVVDTHLFACFTSRGRVHRGLAQALLALEHRGQLQLIHHADAARSLLLGERRVSTFTLRDTVRDEGSSL